MLYHSKLLVLLNHLFIVHVKPEGPTNTEIASTCIAVNITDSVGTVDGSTSVSSTYALDESTISLIVIGACIFIILLVTTVTVIIALRIYLSRRQRNILAQNRM